MGCDRESKMTSRFVGAGGGIKYLLFVMLIKHPKDIWMANKHMKILNIIIRGM